MYLATFFFIPVRKDFQDACTRFTGADSGGALPVRAPTEERERER